MADWLLGYWHSRFARDVFYTTSTKVLTTTLRFGFRVFLLRILTKDDFGAIAALSALALYFDLLAEFSSGTLVQKHLVSNKNDPQKISWYMKLLLLSRITTSVVSAVLFLVASFAMGYIDNGIAITFLTANVLIGAIAVAPDTLLQSTDRFRAFSILNVVVVTITTLASMVIVYNVQTINGFFASLALTTVVSLTCRFVYVRRAYDIDWRVPVARRDVFELIGRAMPLFFGSLFYMLYYRIDVLMLDKLSTRESVADFSVAFSLIDLLVELIWVQFILVFYPKMIEYYRQDKQLMLTRISNVGFFLAAVFALLLIISWLLAPPAFALVFGEQYRYSGVVFTWLVPAHLLTVIFALMYRILIITNRQTIYLTACMLGAVLNIALDYWLIPIYDVMGVIYATLAVNLIICVIVTVAARRSLKS